MLGEIFEKVDLRAILAGHFRTLIDDRTKKTRPSDVVLFYVVPVLVAAGFGFGNLRLSDGALSVITNAFAIIAGLLFNLLVLLHGLSWPKETHPLRKTARRFAQEVYSNIAYSIVVSLAAMLPLTIAANSNWSQTGRLLGGSVAIAIVIHFALTMAMVLRRMYILLQDDYAAKAA